jgi:hypothetical protein
MLFWYFKFEGRFTRNSPEFGKGIFSQCLVPENDFDKAKPSFLNSLKVNHIEVIEVLQEFAFDANLLDSDDQTNKFWIKFYREAQLSDKPVFDIWHLYEIGT